MMTGVFICLYSRSHMGGFEKERFRSEPVELLTKNDLSKKDLLYDGPFKWFPDLEMRAKVFRAVNSYKPVSFGEDHMK